MYPIVYCSTIYNTARTWKQLRCPLTDERIKKMWYIYIMKYYSATKRNEAESVEVMWMNPEPAIQSEVCQKEKNKYCTPANIRGI